MNPEISRADLLQWVNETLRLNIQKIEQLGTGAVYCQFIDSVHPGKIAFQKVNWKAKQEYEFVGNFKILQQSFTKLGLTKPIDIEKLTKCKYQDNLEFLQWFRKYMENHVVSKEYDPVVRRANQELEEQDSRQIRNPSKPKNPKQFQSNPTNLSKNSSYATIQVLGSDQNTTNKENKQPAITDLLIQIETLKNERDFYYSKLRDLDALVEQTQTLSNEQLYKGIKEILYSTTDKSIALQSNGELEMSTSEDQSIRQDDE